MKQRKSAKATKQEKTNPEDGSPSVGVEPNVRWNEYLLDDFTYPYLDQDVKRIFYPKEKLRKYSSDARYARCILEKIVHSGEQKIRDSFNKYIHENFSYVYKKDSVVEYDELLLACTPDEICRAAIKAVQSNQQ